MSRSSNGAQHYLQVQGAGPRGVPAKAGRPESQEAIPWKDPSELKVQIVYVYLSSKAIRI